MKISKSTLTKILLRKVVATLSISLAALSLEAQSGTTIQVAGSLIIGPCGDTLLLRGVNYAPYNWGWSPSELNFSEIAQSGANCVRLPWYATGSGATPAITYSDFVMLDTALAQCVRHDLVPILELHDQTCQNSPTDLINLANWFAQQPVLDLVDKYKHSLILNIANEALYVNWTADPAASQVTYVNTYSTIVSTLRASGITVPIMVDGPDCGTNLDVLAATGTALQLADPMQNLIFSAHAYWYAYAANDSATYQSKVDNALAAGIPFLFGEVANQQDDQVLCQYNLNYGPLLHICETSGIGWLAWSWDRDGCPERQITTSGSFSSLTTFGDDILNNLDYGLATNGTPKSQYLVNEGCLPQTGIKLNPENQAIALFPNPSRGQVSVRLAVPVEHMSIQVHDMLGKLILTQEYAHISELQLTLPSVPGMYFLTLEDGQGWKAVEQALVH